MSALALRACLRATRSVVATVTVADSLQLTVIFSGLPAPPLPPGRSPLTLTLHDGAMLSTKVASEDACGSAAWRAPSLLKSTNAMIVSAPAFAPGSLIVAWPLASSVSAPALGLAPVIVYFSERPAYGTPSVLTAVAATLTGTPRGEPALLGVSWSSAGTALRTVSSKRPRRAGRDRDVLSHSTPPALSTGSPTTLLLKLARRWRRQSATFGQTSAAVFPYASASYFDHAGEVEPHR